MNQPPLNPDALRRAADAVSELYADGHCPKAEDAAEVAVSAYLAAALPEVTSVEELRALPIGSVIIDGDGDAGILEPETIAFGETRPLPYPYVAKHYLPARVLYRPEVKR